MNKRLLEVDALRVVEALKYLAEQCKQGQALAHKAQLDNLEVDLRQKSSELLTLADRFLEAERVILVARSE